MGAGLSQRDLAKRLGISPSAIGQWETGATTPTVANRVDIAKVLNIRFIDLLPEGDGLPNGIIEEDLRKLVALARQLDHGKRQSLLALVAGALELTQSQEAAPPETPRARQLPQKSASR